MPTGSGTSTLPAKARLHARASNRIGHHLLCALCGFSARFAILDWIAQLARRYLYKDFCMQQAQKILEGKLWQSHEGGGTFDDTNEFFPMLILRSLIAVLSCAAMSVAVAAQNLVPNPSFEESSECPKTLTDFAKAVPWFVASGSTDYFHACANADTPLIVGVPQNFKGYQAARTGVGYGGFYLFYSHIRHSNFKKREYMETKLLDSLKKGEQYRVEFYVSLADSSTWAISSVGAYFSDTQIVKISNGYLNYPAQIQNTKGSVLTNKSGWTRISGTFTAKGGERYLLLGNFSSDTTSDTVNVSGNKADIAITYYYIDDVSVTAVNPPSTGIAGETSFGHVQVIPNPVRDRAVLQFANPQAESLMLTIYDVNGQQVRVVRDIRTSPFELDRKGLANGLYFFRLQGAESAVARGKFVLE